SAAMRARRAATLSPHERARAAAFRVAHARDRCVVAHGILRELLAAGLGDDPRGLVFTQDPRGKPRLRPEHLRFSLSHSHDLAMIAIAPDHEVGVDVERWPAEASDLSLAARFFAPRESAALRALPPAERTHAFLELW